MEAFSLMGAHLNVVRKRAGEEAQEGGEDWKAHRGRYVEGIEMGVDEVLGHAVGRLIVWKGVLNEVDCERGSEGALDISKAGIGKSEFVRADTRIYLDMQFTGICSFRVRAYLNRTELYFFQKYCYYYVEP